MSHRLNTYYCRAINYWWPYTSIYRVDRLLFRLAVAQSICAYNIHSIFFITHFSIHFMSAQLHLSLYYIISHSSGRRISIKIRTHTRTTTTRKLTYYFKTPTFFWGVIFLYKIVPTWMAPGVFAWNIFFFFPPPFWLLCFLLSLVGERRRRLVGTPQSEANELNTVINATSLVHHHHHHRHKMSPSSRARKKKKMPRKKKKKKKNMYKEEEEEKSWKKRVTFDGQVGFFLFKFSLYF